MRLRLSFTCMVPRIKTDQLKPHSFEKAVKSGAFSKRYGFIGRVNVEKASIWKRLRILARKWLARNECTLATYFRYTWDTPETFQSCQSDLKPTERKYPSVLVLRFAVVYPFFVKIRKG